MNPILKRAGSVSGKSFRKLSPDQMENGVAGESGGVQNEDGYESMAGACDCR